MVLDNAIIMVLFDSYKRISEGNAGRTGRLNSLRDRLPCDNIVSASVQYELYLH